MGDPDDLDLHIAFNLAAFESDEGYLMEIELDFSSQPQKKMFLRNPQAYMAKKMSNAEVNYRKLSSEDRQLFENAKASEVPRRRVGVWTLKNNDELKILGEFYVLVGSWFGRTFLLRVVKKLSRT